MKKLYTLLLTLFCVLSASALPEELYLVGNFNNWTTPDQDKDLFILSPIGTAGTYSGTFDMPEKFSSLSFKVYTAKTNDNNYAYGTFEAPIYPFCDHNIETKLVTSYDTNPSYPVNVQNWKGGKITFTCTLDESAKEIKLTLITPDQPTTPPYPDNIYVIGEFNDWAIPSASSDNGAIKMTKADDFLKYHYYVARNTAIPSGKAQFIYYYVDPADNKAKFVEGCNYTQPTGIYKLPEDNTYGKYGDWNNIDFIHENLSDARAKATNIINYTGPDLSFQLDWRLEQAVPNGTIISWENAPVNDINNLYLYIENIDTGEKSLVAPDDNNQWNVAFKKHITGNVRIWLTESNTLPIENKWGTYSDTDSSFKYGTIDYTYCIPDGKPITMNLGNSYGHIFMIFTKGSHQIYFHSSPAEYYNAEKLYVIGYLSEWRPPIENYASFFPTLERVSDGIYEGTVNFPSTSGMSLTDPQFRLHYKLNDWGNPGSIGVSYDESNPVNISFTDSQYSSTIITDAKGNWRLPEWKIDGDIKLHVDFNTMTMTLTNLSPNSVKEIESKDMNAPVLYFNLQGQRVINPSNGIFIRVQGAKSEKVILN